MFGRKKASSKASAKTSSTEAEKESTSSKQAKGCSGKKTCSTKSCK